jgi:SHS2 domain-containing protein
LAGVLDEVVCLLDTTRRVPVGVELAPPDGAADVRFAPAATKELPSVGAAHKVLSLHELRLAGVPSGWSW